jgi:Mg2+ and Co2+ transporter CorA
MENILKTPATLSKFQSMSNRSIRLIFDTQENLTDEQISKITLLHEKFIWLTCFYEQATNSEILKEIKNLPPLIKEDFDKSPSQRLRDRLYVYYKIKFKGEDNFNSFYEKTLDTIGNAYLDKIK